MRRRLTVLTASVAAFGFALARAAEPFEVAPDEQPAASLPAAEVAGENFHIAAPVHSDGLMHHYVVESRFGILPAYGHSALTVRLHEVTALTSLSRLSDTDVALRSIGRSLQQNAGAVVDLATNPVRTVTGIPRGIGHLFGGYRAQAQELSGELHQGAQHPDEAHRQSTGRRVVSEAGTQARKYADRYLGISAAEMRWYQKLDVDPYTSNEVLRAAVRHLAKVESATSIGMHFVPVGIPYAGDIRRALDAIYNEDPAVLRKRRRQTLADYGLTPEEIGRFENTMLLSPTRQALLVEAAKTLEGVDGRAELFRHAMTVTSEEEIQVFLHSTRMLVHFPTHQPVTRIVAGLRLPTAQLADGRICLFGSFDAVYWTEDVAGYLRGIEPALPADARDRDVWLAGSVSTRARSELEQRGFRVHEQVPEQE